MNKHFQFITLTVVLLVCSFSWGQVPTCSITPSNTSICSGESVTLNINSNLGSPICNVTDYPANLQNGIISYWPFCGNSNDVSTSNNNGTLQGNISYVADRYGNPNNAIQLNNSTDIMCTSNSYNNPTNFTISIWVKSIQNSPGDFLVSFNNGQCSHSGNWDRTLYLTETQIGFYTYNGFNNYLSANGQYKDGNWHHFAVTLGSLGRKVYVDGQLIIQDNTTSGQNYTGFWRIGGLSPNDINNSSTSTYDDLIIYNRELSASEINQLYQINISANNYQWSTGENSSTIIVSPTQTANYSCTVTNASNSCIASVNIDVINTPVFNLGNDTLTICGNSTILDATNTAAGNYLWNSGATTSTLAVTNSGDYSVTVTDTLGCSSTDSIYVSVIDPNITAQETAFCLGDSTIISINDVSTSDSTLIDQFQMNMFQALNHTTPNLVSGENYVLKVSGTVGFSGGIDSQDAAFQYNWFGTPLTPYAFPNATSVWWYVNGVNTFRPTPDLYNSNHIYYFNFVGNNQPLNITWTDNPYSDNSGQLTFQLLKVNNIPALSSWWSNGTTNQSSIQVQPTQTTTYNVTVSDGVGTCTDSITIQVNNPQINAGSDLSVCEGETATLTATGADTYAWDNGVVNSQAFVPTVEGYYTVTGTDTLGCSNTVSVYLDLLQPTSSTISPTSCNTYTAPDNAVYNNSGQYTAIIPNAAGCDSTITINLTINNSNSGIDSKTACDSYTWIDGNTYTESTNSATFTLQNASGCDSVVTLNLIINKLQTLNAGSDQTVCKGENVTLTASGAQTYSWNNGVADGVAFSPSIGTTTYTVTGTDGNGCTDTDELIVISEYCFEIPGALSPNSDNNNDTWEITGLQNYPNAIISVFDRWGQKVYEGTSTSAPWNGKYQNKDLPTADYYYVIELGNGDKYNGVVTLKR